MSKNLKRLLIVLALLVAYYIHKLIQAAKNLRFSLGRLSSFSLKGNAVSWTQYINITNGEPVAIPVTSVNLLNYVGGQNIGSSVLEGGSFRIAPRSTTAMPIRISIPLIDLAWGVQSVIEMVKSGSFSMRLQGNVGSLGISIPVDQSFKFQIPKF